MTRLELLRINKKLTQQEAADLLEVSRNTYNQIERSKIKNVNKELQGRMEKLFNADYWLLIGEVTEEEHANINKLLTWH